MAKVCKICGCTDDNACITEEGPCSWAFNTQGGPVCSACVFELPKDPARKLWPKDNLLIEKRCADCAHLIEGAPWKDSKTFTCSQGLFDEKNISPGGHHWFALSGIKRPNKTVKTARHSCQDWIIHARWTERDPAFPKLTVLDPEQVEKLWRSGEGMIRNPIKQEGE